MTITEHITLSKPLPMELLAPAGGFEQLRAAIDFGADAVYLAADRFGMRARAANFAMNELPEAVSLAHAAGVKVHLTCNILMMQHDIAVLPAFFEEVADAGIDALIIGDMGAFMLARTYAPNCDLHVSTQASVANAEAAKAWHALGAKRIVCAREMTLDDIAQMRAGIPDELEIEAFVHGAQCMAVSSRCLISSYLTGRSGNQGHCTQPCRWSYTVEEEKRPGVHFPIEEDARGTYLMNAKDLAMIAHVEELAQAGVNSVKIEGRNKKAFYVATVVHAYRRALDEGFTPDLMEELEAVSHRPYSTGFYFGDPEQAVGFDGYEQQTMHVADVVGCEPDMSVDADQAHPELFQVRLRCRNRFAEGDELEVLSPGQPTHIFTVKDLRWLPDAHDVHAPSEPLPVEVANRSCAQYGVTVPFAITPGSFIRVRTYRRSARSLRSD